MAIHGQGDDVVALIDRQPAEALHAVERGADAAGTVVGQRRHVIEAEAEFFVLGADPPILARRAAVDQILDQLTLVGHCVRRTSHGIPSTRCGNAVLYTQTTLGDKRTFRNTAPRLGRMKVIMLR